jgi:phage terminase Nu1 subunit (DNA packaging protein)
MHDVLDEYISRDQLAEQLEVSPRTLERWHRLSTGPARCKVGQKVLYHRQAVASWLRSRESATNARAAS